MSGPVTFLIGVIVGVAGTGYFTIQGFRERVNSVFSGLVWGKKGRSKRPQEEAKKVVKKKQHTCMRCGELGTIDDMDEASIGDSKATAWIHTHCLKNLPENSE